MPVRQCPHCKAIQPVPETPTAATVDCQVCGRSINLVRPTATVSKAYLLLALGIWIYRAGAIITLLVFAIGRDLPTGLAVCIGLLILGEALNAIRDAAINSWKIKQLLLSSAVMSSPDDPDTMS